MLTNYTVINILGHTAQPWYLVTVVTVVTVDQVIHAKGFSFCRPLFCFSYSQNTLGVTLAVMCLIFPPGYYIIKAAWCPILGPLEP